MKIFLLIFLLITYIVSQIEDYIENYIKDYIMSKSCNASDGSQNRCWTAKLPESGKNCCQYKSNLNTGCYIYTDYELKKYTDSKEIAMYREEEGYSFCLERKKKNCLPSDYMYYDITCDKINFSFEKYTDEEMNIFKNQNHCLNYYYYSIVGNLIVSKEECENAEMLPSTKNMGIKCAYYEFTFTLDNDKKQYFKTCDLLDPEQIKSPTKEFIEELDDLGYNYMFYLEDYDKGDEDKYTFTIDISASDGISAKYDSTTGKLIENDSHIIFISKYLFLLFIFLL